MKCHAFALLIFFVMGGSAEASTIKAVQGQKILIEMDPGEAAEGDLLFAISPEGKKAGLIRIHKVQNGRALGLLVKGRANKGWQAQLSKPGQPAQSNTLQSAKPHSFVLVGGLVGAAMDSQTVVISATNIALTGVGFSGYGFMDYFFTDAISVRALLGVEMYNSSALINLPLCEGNSTSCNLNFMALSGGALLRWTFLPGDIGIWGGLGGYYLYPLSKSSTAVEASLITSAAVLAPAVGVDLSLSPGFYLTLQAEYGTFLNSEWNSKWIAGRGGLAFRF